MQLLFWLLLGLFAGGIVAVVMKDTKKFTAFLDILLGAVGAVLAGIITNAFTFQNVIGLYDETILLAVIGAGILIWVGRSILIHNNV